MEERFLRDREGNAYRVLEKRDKEILVVRCDATKLPFWISECEYAEDLGYRLPCPMPMEELTAKERCTATQRFTMISGILPFIGDAAERGRAVSRAAREYGASQPTVRKYLCLYLAYQKKEALAPKRREQKKELTEEQKNIRWGLNKFYYNTRKNSLHTAYTLMLKEKYCDETGNLEQGYPSFYKFRYYYRTHNKKKNQLIKRNGLSYYQRNGRPCVGDGVQQYAPCVGTGMLDSTVCDIYLANEAGQVVGRPILAACVDAYSGLCMGYSLSWEGGVYSLRNLMLNVISDKRGLCREHGIMIGEDDWPSRQMPGRLVTDMGAEYASENFSQLSELGVTIVNLPPYRPELKGPVEKFFDVVQNYYKPMLAGKGVVEADYRERGAQDYRKDACLTLKDFEKVILHCILFYNGGRTVSGFPYTEEMLTAEVRPYANHIWNWGCGKKEANLLDIPREELVLALLPRTTAKFTRYGLKANRLRYHNGNYDEKYLEGKEVLAAYNPDDAGCIWLVEDGEYIRFTLVEKRFGGRSFQETEEMHQKKKCLVKKEEENALKARIAMAAGIQAASGACAVPAQGSMVKDIRNTRKKEQKKEHIRLEVEQNE